MDDIPEGLWQRDIAYLEFMIRLGNKLIHWLNSDDPMFQQEEYRALVAPTKDRLTTEVRQMIIVCRQKKVERDGLEAEFVEHVRVGLKTGHIKTKALK